MPIQSLEDLLEDKHLQKVGFWKSFEHPTEGTLRIPDTPWTAGEEGVHRLPPLLGEQSLEILREAGFSGAEIDVLVGSGAVAAAEASHPKRDAV